ncbi:S9 family peptidase [Paenactinomyces guangxiensis]|uniref:S9 family peptidase n=1 Tax=Paenactinomyces guangxiensis TaxID=1490290 RepID=A0A7W1WMV3_9BACL|nr:S9 family peptidase [Paenactinomyces guangxiensis]MBA4492804.1 S9 family peptidase [Paenactinomyces guangxiensis]MBH8590347.1 S9 family peptidase [Paenactinomyces guangxiensis]
MLKFGKPDVEQFFRTYGIQRFAVSPDEKQLVFSTNLNGKYDLWAMDLPHSFPYPLTFNGQNCHDLRFDKQGRFILASFDHDGDENIQIYALPRQGGHSIPICPAKKRQNRVVKLSGDGQRLYYYSNKENNTFFNSYCYHIGEDREEVVIEGKDVPTYLGGVSDDEKTLVFYKFFSNTYIPAYVKRGGQTICLTSEQGPAHTVSDVVFYKGDSLLITTNFGQDFSYLAHFNLQTRSLTRWLSLDKEDIKKIEYHPGDTHLYLITSKGVRDFLCHFDLETKQVTNIPLPVDVISQMVVTETGNLYILGNRSTRPWNIYCKRKNSAGWKMLTHFQVPAVAEEELVEPDVLTYPSFDGIPIEALFFRARPEASNGHVILWPHGGPQAAERKNFRALFQFLAHRGYSIFAPNFRGSAGYGITFARLVEGDWGHGPRLDLIAGLDWLIRRGDADRDKIFLMGGSYGGYMALLLAGRHPEYFKAVVDIFGPSNLFSFINSVPEHWKPTVKQWVGDPEKDRDKLIADSPDTYLDRMVKPVLVIQGENDPRVVKAQSDQIVDKLKQNGTEVEYLVLEDEGHGFSKKENEILVYRKVLQFLDRFL